MNLVCSIVTGRIAMVVSLLLVFSPAFRTALAQGSRPIQFSAPRDETSSTNQQKLSTRHLQDELLKARLKDQIFRPFDFSEDALQQGLPGPPRQAPNAAETRHRREELERRKEWMMMNPDDWNTEAATEELFGLSRPQKEGGIDKLLTPQQRFYSDLERKASTNQAQALYGRRRLEGDFTFQPGGAENANSLLPDATGNSGRMTNSLIGALFQGEAGSVSSFQPVFADVFKPNPMPVELTRQQLERSREYKQILDGPSTSLSSSAFSAPKPTGSFLDAPKPAPVFGNAFGSSSVVPVTSSSSFGLPAAPSFGSPVSSGIFGFGTAPDQGQKPFSTPGFTPPASTFTAPIAPAVLPIPRRGY